MSVSDGFHRGGFEICRGNRRYVTYGDQEPSVFRPIGQVLRVRRAHARREMFVRRARAIVVHAAGSIDIRTQFLLDFVLRGSTVLHSVRVAFVLHIHHDDLCPVRELREDG